MRYEFFPVPVLNPVADFSRLARAFHRAARGKRTRAEVQRFEAHLELRLAALSLAIRKGGAPRGVFRRFQIRDPKPRVIHAPVFEDRVVHHALLDVIGSGMDRALVPDTFACRVGKGSLAAVDRAQEHLRRWPWYVKIDVAKYFASIPHARLVRMLAKKMKDRGLIAFVSHIVEQFHHAPGRGLPIGALTSQHFANFYLRSLDEALSCRDRRVVGFVRYMDDAVWWTRSRDDAVRTLRAAHEIVESLGLRVKENSFIQRSEAGLSFLGFRIYRGCLKLSPRQRRRFRAGRAAWERVFLEGRIDALALQRGYDAARAIVAHAESARFYLRAFDLRVCPFARRMMMDRKAYTLYSSRRVPV